MGFANMIAIKSISSFWKLDAFAPAMPTDPEHLLEQFYFVRDLGYSCFCCMNTSNNSCHVRSYKKIKILRLMDTFEATFFKCALYYLTQLINN